MELLVKRGYHPAMPEKEKATSTPTKGTGLSRPGRSPAPKRRPKQRRSPESNKRLLIATAVGLIVIVGGYLAFAGDSGNTGASVSASVSPTSPAPPPPLPVGTPAAIDADTASGDLDPVRLVPDGSSPLQTWFMETSRGETAVVSYEYGRRPEARRGYLVWTHSDEAPHWSPLTGKTFEGEERPRSIDATVGDATSDGSDDVLMRADLGGSGSCSSWDLIDVAQPSLSFHDASRCDATYSIGSDPSGLVLVENVYRPGDAHCCPSSIKTSVLEVSEMDRWVISQTRTEPAPNR